MKLTKYNQLVDGLRVRCKIKEVQVDDAMLLVDHNGTVFIANNKYGWDSSKFLSDTKSYAKGLTLAYENEIIGDWNPDITDLESIEDEPKKGFDPKNLTFDGVKIKEGDIITIYGGKTKRVRWSGQLAHIRLREIDEEPYRPLSMFNVIAHYPAQPEKSKLEEAELKYYDARDAFGPNDYNNLDRYYQARKRLDELENK